MSALARLRRAVAASGAWLLVLAGGPAMADELPPRAQWRATASAVENDALGPAQAVDGRADTRWSSPFEDGHWLALDLGAAVRLCGLALHWDAAYARHHRLEVSDDGQAWRTVVETPDARGGHEWLVFAATRARHLRLTGVRRGTAWGVSLMELQPLAEGHCPRVAAARGGGALLWQAAPADWPAGAAAVAVPAAGLTIELNGSMHLAGLAVDWQRTPAQVRLLARTATGWVTLADDRPGDHPHATLAATQAVTTDALRLTVSGAGANLARVARLRLLGPEAVQTPLSRLQQRAARLPAGRLPRTLSGRQTYWTTVGEPGAADRAVLDEDGHVEPWRGAPLLQPLLRASGGRLLSAADATVEPALHDDWMPLPSLHWRAAGVPEMQIEALPGPAESGATPGTWVRWRLLNRTPRRLQGQLVLALRPLQVNPPWQHGGVAAVTAAQWAVGGRAELQVNGRRYAQFSRQPADARIGLLEREDVAAAVGQPARRPPSPAAAGADGLLSAAASWPYDLAPGAQVDLVAHLPARQAQDTPPDAPTTVGFDAQREAAAQAWRQRLSGLQVELPQPQWVHALKAQVAYTLLNQSGAALMPGPRNYDRSFVRDGESSARVLLRAGRADDARRYLDWVARHAVHADGLVSPILNVDGSVNRGFGSDLEYDSQGQFVSMVADVARLDGGAAAVSGHADAVRRALAHLERLRERTLVPGYRADAPAPGRFRGILPPSISHEGYATPQHSYWDDAWALKGWRDGAWLFDAWGDAEAAAWARAQGDALRAALAASVRVTMAWKGLLTLPASADLGDGDPTSVAIMLEPTRQAGVLPAEALRATFDGYVASTRRRSAQPGSPGASGAYTAYEFRNVPALLHLGRRGDAWWLMQTLFADRRPQPWQLWAEVVHADPRRGAYLGDMPHTWVGAEYAHAFWSLILHEGLGADEGLTLLPGVPAAWLAGPGLRVAQRATPLGMLGFSAQFDGSRFRLRLEPGLPDGTTVRVAWPEGFVPVRVNVDGRSVAPGVGGALVLRTPFSAVEAQR